MGIGVISLVRSVHFSNILGSSTWAELYVVKHIGSITALTTAIMVFATAFGTAVFGATAAHVFGASSDPMTRQAIEGSGHSNYFRILNPMTSQNQNCAE